jgi:NADPH2:quinone reductase
VRAAWYDRTGPAREVLEVGELQDPVAAAGEVVVALAAAGVNPADVKRRAGAGGRAMSAARVVPGDDGAGVVAAVGAGVDRARIGERVWVHNATLGRPWGCSAELVAIPADHATRLPDDVPYTVGACLGVPALTAHRAVFADGPVSGRTVLVTGGAGAVGRYAIQLARWGGARVVATASTSRKREAAAGAGAEQVVDYRRPDAAARLLDAAGPVDRVVDVAFGANLPLTETVLAANGTIAAYGSDADPQPAVPFYPLMRRDARLHFVSVFAMPITARRAAIADVNRLLERGELTPAIGATHPIEQIAAAHEAVETGSALGQVVLVGLGPALS